MGGGKKIGVCGGEMLEWPPFKKEMERLITQEEPDEFVYRILDHVEYYSESHGRWVLAQVTRKT